MHDIPSTQDPLLYRSGVDLVGEVSQGVFNDSADVATYNASFPARLLGVKQVDYRYRYTWKEVAWNSSTFLYEDIDNPRQGEWDRSYALEINNRLSPYRLTGNLTDTNPLYYDYTPVVRMWYKGLIDGEEAYEFELSDARMVIELSPSASPINAGVGYPQLTPCNSTWNFEVGDANNGATTFLVYAHSANARNRASGGDPTGWGDLITGRAYTGVFTGRFYNGIPIYAATGVPSAIAQITSTTDDGFGNYPAKLNGDSTLVVALRPYDGFVPDLNRYYPVVATYALDAANREIWASPGLDGVFTSRYHTDTSTEEYREFTGTIAFDYDTGIHVPTGGSAGGTRVVRMRDATPSNWGAVTTALQDIGGQKRFFDSIVIYTTGVGAPGITIDGSNIWMGNSGGSRIAFQLTSVSGPNAIFFQIRGPADGNDVAFISGEYSFRGDVKVNSGAYWWKDVGTGTEYQGVTGYVGRYAYARGGIITATITPPTVLTGTYNLVGTY